jgi:hypothetical protein
LRWDSNAEIRVAFGPSTVHADLSFDVRWIGEIQPCKEHSWFLSRISTNQRRLTFMAALLRSPEVVDFVKKSHSVRQ